MQMLASEFKQTREPKIQKFRGGTSSGTLLVFKSWMQDIECAIKDRNLNNEEALQLVKEFSEGCAHDNINFTSKSRTVPVWTGYSKTYDRFFHQEKRVSRCWLNSIVAYKIKKNRLRNLESHYCKKLEKS